jgi:spermidine/putrescine transport system substrate-binding protein
MTRRKRVDQNPGARCADGLDAITDPALIRGLTQRRFDRRDVLRFAGIGAGALALSGLAEACSIPGIGVVSQQPGPKGSPTANPFAGKPTGTLDFANWPYYIDFDTKTHTRPSIDKFEQVTGIKVSYSPVINGNDTFFAKIQPALQAGQPTGYDLMVITNGTVLDKLIKFGYLTPLDQSKMTNFYKYGDESIVNPSYDPGNKYTMAWQSGYTGIGYDPKKTKRPITSMQDLRDPAFKGKIGMFADNADLPSLALLAIGVKPETSTPDDWRKAAQWLLDQRPLVRAYYDQGYITALENGDIWVTMAWSGDIFIANTADGYPDLKFVVPTEGGALWTDNMCIPIRAEHPVDAITYMDYVYQPAVAGTIADWVEYITPVQVCRDYILNVLKDPVVGNSPLVFPTAADLAKGHRYYVFKNDAEEELWNSIFQPIYQG